MDASKSGTRLAAFEKALDDIQRREFPIPVPKAYHHADRPKPGREPSVIFPQTASTGGPPFPANSKETKHEHDRQEVGRSY
jgi:hypothetical protein